MYLFIQPERAERKAERGGPECCYQGSNPTLRCKAVTPAAIIAPRYPNTDFKLSQKHEKKADKIINIKKGGGAGGGAPG